MTLIVAMDDHGEVFIDGKSVRTLQLDQCYTPIRIEIYAQFDVIAVHVHSINIFGIMFALESLPKGLVTSDDTWRCTTKVQSLAEDAPWLRLGFHDSTWTTAFVVMDNAHMKLINTLVKNMSDSVLWASVVPSVGIRDIYCRKTVDHRNKLH